MSQGPVISHKRSIHLKAKLGYAQHVKDHTPNKQGYNLSGYLSFHIII